MYHSVLKVLATFCTSSLPEQSTPYTMDLFDISDDPTPVDSITYQRCVGALIWLLKLRFETQLAIIMACTHNPYPMRPNQSHPHPRLLKRLYRPRTYLVHN